MKIIIKLLLCLSLISAGLLPEQAYSHSEHTGDEPDLEHYLGIIEKLGNLNIEDTTSLKSLEASTRIAPLPFFNIGGKRIQVDNAFWDLADELSRLYIHEIKESCNECEMPSVEEIQKEARDMVARGWLRSTAVGIADAVTYRYASQFITLASKYGTAAGILKVVGELIEDAMLVVFKMPGAHFLCEAITFAISYYSGAFLTISRAFTYPRHFKQGRISTLIRTAVASYYIRRSLKRLTIDVPEFSIDEEALAEFKDEHPERKATYKVTGRHRVESFLKKLETSIGKKRERIEALKTQNGLSKSQREKLLRAETEGLQTTIKIKKKVFGNQRYKRFLLLRKRHQKDSLNEFATNTSPLFKKSDFWFFELKNEIFEPNVQLKAATEVEASTPRSRQRALDAILSDPVGAYQLSAFEDTNSKEVVSHVFETLDFIGSKDEKMTQRYFNFAFMEAFFGNFLQRLFSEVIEHNVEDLDRSERKMKSVSALQWHAGKIMYFTNIFVDFVRFSAFDTKNADPTMKYHIRDYALKLLQVYSDFSSFDHLETDEEIRSAAALLKEKVNELDRARFWEPKTHKHHLLPETVRNILYFNWLPWRSGAPVCESLYL